MATKTKELVIPTGIGAKVDLRQKLKAQKEEADAVAKAIEEQIDAVEKALFEQMEREGTENGGGKTATVSIIESIVPQISDWDSLTKYVKRTGYFHLFQRRISTPAFRELAESKGVVPGLTAQLVRRLNFTSKKV